MDFKHSNCIVVFDKDKEKVLFCKRKKEPFKGLYNFVGGKVESGETSDAAAYRELQEEVNPLEWMSVKDEDFADMGKFAGMQNIAHIIQIAMQFPFPAEQLKMDI